MWLYCHLDMRMCGYMVMRSLIRGDHENHRHHQPEGGSR
jgi:hypothetical protein